MSQRYIKRTQRSRRKSPARILGQVSSIGNGSIQLSLPLPELLSDIGQEVERVAFDAGLLVMKALLDDEVQQLAGERYRHQPDRQASRWGTDQGYVVYAGRKVAIKRARVRGQDGGERILQRYRAFQADTRMQRAIQPRVLARVAMRQYGQVIDDVCDGYGIEKSSVSRHWKVASAEQLRQLLERPLSPLDILVVMIDGIRFHNYSLVVGLGIDTKGQKHVLGFWPGASENAELCQALLQDLIERGLQPDRKYLFVLDGAKALTKAVRAAFGKRAEVQRCQYHKEKNVLSYLPEKFYGQVRQRLRAALGLKNHADASKALQDLVRFLERLSSSAANSLREGQEELLTVHRLGVPEQLRRTLRTTNPIESCFSGVRDLCRNVKRWRSEEMARRWAGTMLLEVESHCRRLKGYREMPVLIQALRGADRIEEVA